LASERQQKEIRSKFTKGRAIPTHQLGDSSAVESSEHSAERLLLSLSVSKKSLEVGGLEKRTKKISSRD